MCSALGYGGAGEPWYGGRAPARAGGEGAMSKPVPGPYYVMVSPPGRGLSIHSRDGWQVAAMLPQPRGGNPATVGANADLLAAAWELREALEAIEWSRHGIVHGQIQPICAACDAPRDEGHLPGCIVDTALRKARGRASPW